MRHDPFATDKPNVSDGGASVLASRPKNTKRSQKIKMAQSGPVSESSEGQGNGSLLIDNVSDAMLSALLPQTNFTDVAALRIGLIAYSRMMTELTDFRSLWRQFQFDSVPELPIGDHTEAPILLLGRGAIIPVNFSPVASHAQTLPIQPRWLQKLRAK